MNSKINKWYDGLQEPKRFCVFIIPVSVLVAGAANGGTVVTFISVALLLFAVVSRALHVFGVAKGA